MSQTNVTLRNGKKVSIAIGSSDKPEIPKDTSEKWDSILNLLCKMLKIDVALIMKVEDGSISVLRRSQFSENPYHVGETAKLGDGLYCETVLGTRASLAIPNALTDSVWSTNPDVSRNMISYLGFPIEWPDGELLGTICVLDRKENFQDSLPKEILSHFKDVIQSDLKNIVEKHELKQLDILNKLSLRETFHRIKNQLCQLYSIIQLNSDSPNLSMDFIDMVLKRLKAMITVQDILSLNQEDSIDLVKLSETLSSKLITDVYGKSISLSVLGDKVDVAPDVALAEAAIINELITNSVKHAFSGVEFAKIDIEISDIGDKFAFEYRDNGPGFSNSKCDNKGFTIGLSLLKTYPLLINGASEIYHQGHFCYKMTASKLGK